MKYNIAGNDFCPCMSGKRYKKCCMDKIEVLRELPGGKIAENYVLEKILDNSSIFRNFYKSERGKVAEDLHFCLNPHSPSSMKSGSMELTCGGTCLFIVIKQAPLEPVDAVDIAHEIQHLICRGEGYPSLLALEGSYFDITGMLSNITNDPVVNARLAEFGFDIWEYYDKACAVQKEHLDSYDENEELDAICLTALYLQKALDWDVACKATLRSNNEFLAWLTEKYPRSASKAKEILSGINEVGYETPEKSRLAWQGILEKFGLQAAFRVL